MGGETEKLKRIYGNIYLKKVMDFSFPVFVFPYAYHLPIEAPRLPLNDPRIASICGWVVPDRDCATSRSHQECHPIRCRRQIAEQDQEALQPLEAALRRNSDPATNSSTISAVHSGSNSKLMKQKGNQLGRN